MNFVSFTKVFRALRVFSKAAPLWQRRVVCEANCAAEATSRLVAQLAEATTKGKTTFKTSFDIF